MKITQGILLAGAFALGISNTALGATTSPNAPPIDQINRGSFQFTNTCDGTLTFNYLLKFVVQQNGDIVSEGIANFALGTPPDPQPFLQYFSIVFHNDGKFDSVGYTFDSANAKSGKWTGKFTKDSKGSHFTFKRFLSNSGNPCVENATGTFGPVPSPAAF